MARRRLIFATDTETEAALKRIGERWGTKSTTEIVRRTLRRIDEEQQLLEDEGGELLHRGESGVITHLLKG